MTSPGKEHLEKHYEDLSDKPFFKGLVTCMTGPMHIAIRESETNRTFRHVERPNRRHGLGRP